MHLDLRPFLVLWAIVIAALVVVAFWRRSVAVQEDPALHLGAAHAGTAAEQIALAKKLEQIDKWMKILTVAVIVFGLLLGAAALYKGWVLGPSGL
jgi:preprotein translocase subunit SecG